MRRPRDDRGFTLVELLLALTLLGLISGPLVGAIFVVLKSTSYTLDRAPSAAVPNPVQGTAQDQLATSQDQRLLDAAFATDGQGSLTVTTTRPGCTPAVAGAVSLVAFSTPDSSGGSVTVTRSAWYYLLRPAPDPVTGAPRLAVIHRASCSATPAAPTAALSGSARDVVVTRAVGPTNPTLTCDGTALPCAATTRVVAMQVKLGLDSSTTFGVQAQRRLS